MACGDHALWRRRCGVELPLDLVSLVARYLAVGVMLRTGSTRVGMGVLAGGLVIAGLAAGASPVAAASTNFPYTGSSQSYSVPDGVSVIKIEALGAGGGGYGAVGGAGAVVTAYRTVNSASSLTVRVGGGGGPGTADAGGGAATAVYETALGTADAQRVVAGGGGGGADHPPSIGGSGGGTGGIGGDGGGTTFGSGGSNSSGGAAGAPGGGAGGNSGSNGNDGFVLNSGGLSDSVAGGAGGFTGGNGGGGGGFGGGGGGGFCGGGGGGGFGGGGGGGGCGPSGGGGAGSSTGPSPSGATAVSYAPGSNGGVAGGAGGNGSVTITALDQANIASPVPGNGEVTVGWTDPSQPVGGVTYTVYQDGVSTGVTSSPARITGLANGQNYTFTVVATTSDGLKTTSAAVSAIPKTPAKLPQTQKGVSTKLHRGSNVVNSTNATTLQRLPLSARVTGSSFKGRATRGDLVCYTVKKGPKRKLTLKVTGQCKKLKVKVTYTAPGNATYLPYRKTLTFKAK